MGCGCVSQHQASLTGGPRHFLSTQTDEEFLSDLKPEELKDKKLLLAYFHQYHEGKFEVTPQFREMVRRRGVPPRYRWLAWRDISGWHRIAKTRLFERCCQRPPDPKTVDAIEKDIDRTFPKNEDFTEERREQLATILRAYASLFPQVGYCQGMNFVAGFLLLASPGGSPGQTEAKRTEDAFYIFLQVMWKYHANLLFCDGLPLLKLFTFQFHMLLERLFPEVHKHFVQEDINPENYATKWLMTLFTQHPSFAVATRIWDLIICDGLQAVVHVALANVKLLKARLLRQTAEGLLDLLNLRADVLPEGGAIVQAALGLKLGSPCGPGVDARLSKLELAWARESPNDAAALDRARFDLCADGESLPDLAGLDLAPPEAFVDEKAEYEALAGEKLAQLKAQAAVASADLVAASAQSAGPPDAEGSGRGAAAGEDPATGALAADEGVGKSSRRPSVKQQEVGAVTLQTMAQADVAAIQNSPHMIAAEAKVDIKASMPTRKPAAMRAYSPTTPADTYKSAPFVDAATACAPVMEQLSRLSAGGKRRSQTSGDGRGESRERERPLVRLPPEAVTPEVHQHANSDTTSVCSSSLGPSTEGSPPARQPDLGMAPRLTADKQWPMSPLSEEGGLLASTLFSTGSSLGTGGSSTPFRGGGGGAGAANRGIVPGGAERPLSRSGERDDFSDSAVPALGSRAVASESAKPALHTTRVRTAGDLRQPHLSLSQHVGARAEAPATARTPLASRKGSTPISTCADGDGGSSDEASPERSQTSHPSRARSSSPQVHREQSPSATLQPWLTVDSALGAINEKPPTPGRSLRLRDQDPGVHDEESHPRNQEASMLLTDHSTSGPESDGAQSPGYKRKAWSSPSNAWATPRGEQAEGEREAEGPAPTSEERPSPDATLAKADAAGVDTRVLGMRADASAPTLPTGTALVAALVVKPPATPPTRSQAARRGRAHGAGRARRGPSAPPE